ncbi:glucosyl-3-phosphoglycerate synthase [Amycolatopsis lurida]
MSPTSPSAAVAAPGLSEHQRAWLETRTSRAADWPVRELLDAKGTTTVSVVLPARNEATTVGAIVRMARRHPLVDELVVVDSGSTDSTGEVAESAGARVVRQEDVLDHLPTMTGKGEALWKGLYATEGDVVAFLDADLVGCPPDFVTGLIGPLLTSPDVQFVKGFYHRPLVRPGRRTENDGGGRVTELVARPLLNLYWPELAGFVQPLAGEYAGRREALESVPFVCHYGVEIALLIDLAGRHGVAAMAQVDLGRRRHRHQDTAALGRMATQIMLTAFGRLEREGRAPAPTRLPARLAQFRAGHGTEQGREVVVTEVDVPERPSLAEVRAELATAVPARRP